MKEELERMKTRLAELRMRKTTILARSAQSRGGAGAEQLGSKKPGSSAFDNFRRMEERIEGREAEGAAMAEVEDALGKGRRSDDVEAKFRELEARTAGGAGAAGSSDVDEELAALKKRIRIG
jgi:phage shock protein A